MHAPKKNDYQPHIDGNTLASPIVEVQSPAPVNHYATSKAAMEYMAMPYSSVLPLFFVRPFNYTGPLQSPNFIIPKLVSHFVKKSEVIELGNIDVEREFNDVRFVCDTYIKLLTTAKVGDICNIFTGTPISLTKIIETLAQLTGYKIKVVINPSFVRSNEIKQLYGSP